MRHFYVKSTKGATGGDLNVKDMAGGAGRLDIIARCINNAFWISHSLRNDVVFHTVLHGEPNPPQYIKIEGDRLRKVQPDERNISIFIKKAIDRAEDYRVVQSTPGIFIRKKGFEELVEDNIDKQFYILSEDGEDISDPDILSGDKEPFFVLGDKEDLDEDELGLLLSKGAKKISLGKRQYLTSHCIGFLNIWLDRKG